MTQKYIIKNAHLINEGRRFEADLRIVDGRIDKIAGDIPVQNETVIDASGLWLMPGVIDDQVHFREPGLTHKAEIYTESRAAVAGGTTSYMEMPNTKPGAVTQELLADKYEIASRRSLANYSFFMGTTNDNLEEILKTDGRNVCGVKIFMGSSTGNMLVDNPRTLENIFSQCPLLIATHCEDEQSILRNTQWYEERFGDSIPVKSHPEIRNDEVCHLSSHLAVEMAKSYGTRLHILHLTTERELHLFRNDIPLNQKKITSEVCVHHLTFESGDYQSLGTLIKCNPSIKYEYDRRALWDALNDDRLDIIATDHAPHTMEEKHQPYHLAPSGLPLVQHSLVMMLEHVKNGMISLERMVEKMCHAPAECFRVSERGYLREGYWADLVLVDPNNSTEVKKDNLLYKCGWSPLEGRAFSHSVHKTFVSGNLVYDRGRLIEGSNGMRLLFDRD